jgi:HK97 family phage major capsid protein
VRRDFRPPTRPVHNKQQKHRIGKRPTTPRSAEACAEIRTKEKAMPNNIKTLLQRETESKKKLRVMLDKAAAENRDLNESEAAVYEEELKALVGTEKSIEREQMLLERERRTEPVEDPNERAAAAAGAPGQKKGFESLGEQLQAIMRYEKTKGAIRDARLFAGPAGLDEAIPSEGGFLVQKDFSSEMLQRMYETGQVLSRCRKIPLSGNSNGVKINAIDEDSRADGSRWGGVLAYWIDEAAALTGTKPKFRRIELILNKLIALCYATDELLEDAAALEAVIQQAFAEEMTFRVEDAIFNGVGAGQPLGLLNSGALITVSPVSGESSPTVSTTDILAMWSRRWARSGPNMAWFIDQSVEPALIPLTVGSGSLAQTLLYTPPGKDGKQQGGSMLGCPVIVTEHGQQLGTPGDIILADLSQYVVIDKNGVRQDYSMHVNFLTDEGVFRFVYRVDGQAWWKKPLTPKSGGPTQSPYIVLGTR